MARALVTDPALILADEPTGNLDQASGHDVLELLRELNPPGSTIVLITHDAEVAASAGRQVHIRDGRLVRMRILELIRLAFSRLRTGRLRAALTMLGVIIGVASVVALVGVGQGTTSSITQRLSSLGTNLLTISAAGANGGASSTLTSEDATAIRAIAGVAGVAPESQTQAVVGADGETTTTSIIGTTADYASVRAYDVWQGTFLTDTAVEQSCASPCSAPRPPTTSSSTPARSAARSPSAACRSA